MADTDPILRPAIEAALSAEAADPDQGSDPVPDGVLVSYVVVAVVKGFDSDGEDTSYTAIYPHGSITEQLGMIREADIRYQAEVVEQYRGR